ncbi:thiamine pyrophosphate-binding protein [Bradyrhizobium sp.]|jgi:acetolactate synthase-1/2/3 large subunit|uniref:thiamine pyrophosphate-binding protein n=1 Tax=Bradyrhizobium sp. TaxID=376 RepID=UPI002DFA28C3|nr:thiamine pyrophosphate-binding protein [Bradyrhizobium sp.]
MTVAEFVAQFLRERCFGTVFMLSGTGSIFLDNAIAKEKGLSYICSRHEATAAIMAAASSKISGKVGAVIVTTGPGAVNAIAGVIEAWVDSIPLLVISGQVSNAQIAPRARTFGIQGFNILGVASPMTKYSAIVRDPKSIRFHLEKAFHEAQAGRPGPAWLDIPFDVQSSEIGDPAHLNQFTAAVPVISISATDSVARVIDFLRASRRPVCVLGQGVRQSGATEAFRQLIDTLRIPVVATRAALGVMTDSHPLYMGLGGIKGRPHTGLVLEKADLVISLGCSLSHGFAGDAWDAFSPSAKIVMVDFDAAELDKVRQHVTLPILLDVKLFIDELLDAADNVALPRHGEWIAECQKAKAAHPVLRSDQYGDPINSYHLIQRLEAHANEGHIFVSDTGGAYYTTGQALKFDRNQRELTSVAFANMGIALPLAIGAAAGDPTAEIICVSGDGSIEVNIQELRTIVQHGLPIKVFVINNGGYGSIRDSQDEFCKGEYTDDTEVLDFEKVASAFNLPFTRIASVRDLDSSIARVLSRRGPEFVEVICDTQQKIAVPLRERTTRKTLGHHLVASAAG